MNNDIEFTLGLDISPTEKQISLLEAKLQTIEKTLSKIARVPPTNIKATDYFNNRSVPVVSGSRSLYKPSPIWDIGGYGALPGYKYAGHSSTYNRFMTPATSGSRINSNGLFWRGDIADAVFKKKPYNPFSGGVVPPTNNGGSGKPPSNEEENQEQKEILDNEKKEGIEQKNSLFLLTKKIAQLYVIKKLIDAIVGAWKKFGGHVGTEWSNIRQDSGFFSVDPVGALRANRDKTRALLYAGIRNLGPNSPISVNAIDEMSNKFTEVWTAAVSGRNVDKRTTIDIDRLKRYFGIDMSAEALLTGQRNGKTATDLMIDAMNKVEKGIGSLENLTEVELGQVVDSIKNIFGREIADAIVANYNINKKLSDEDKQLLTEKIMQYGGTAIPAGNLTESTDKAIKSLGRLSTSIEALWQVITVQFSPAFIAVTETVTKFTDFLSRWLNKNSGSEKDEIGVEDTNPLTISAAINSSATKRTGYYHYEDLMKGVVEWWTKSSDKKEDVKDTYKNKAQLMDEWLKSNDINKILSVPLLAQPEIKSAYEIEGMHVAHNQRLVKEAFKKRFFDPNSTNAIISGLGNFVYNGKQGFEALELLYGPLGGNVGRFFGGEDLTPEDFEDAMQVLLQQNVIRDMFRTNYRKGGKYDFNTNKIPVSYLLDKSVFGSEQEYLSAVADYINDTKASGYADKALVELISKWDKNKDGKVDIGELRLVITLNDLEGNSKTVSVDNPSTVTVNAIK